MRKGRITIPTDENYVEGTKRIADLWGADAVRDCDGVKLPKNPKEIADKVFDLYFTTKENTGGTGIGLYLTRSIIEKHFGGAIRCFNEEDGVCFEIRVPLEEKSAPLEEEVTEDGNAQ